MKAVIIAKETQSGVDKGKPNLSVGYSGFVYIGNLPGQYAVYLVTGSASQLTNIQADPNCVGGALITESGVKWGEMNDPISAALRTKINTYRQAQGQSNIPAGTTLLQVVRFAANHFDGQGNFDCFDAMP